MVELFVRQEICLGEKQHITCDLTDCKQYLVIQFSNKYNCNKLSLKYYSHLGKKVN